MEYDLKNVNAKANAGMATGITALGIEALGLLGGGLNGLLGKNNNTCSNGADNAAIMAMAATIGSMVNTARSCSDDHVVDRYEAGLQAKIAEQSTEIKLRDAATFTLGEMNKMRNYVDERFTALNNELCRQAVINQKTEDAFRLVESDLRRERDERCCGDNAIVNYANATFYPKLVADVTAASTTTAQAVYNPIPGCNCCK